MHDTEIKQHSGNNPLYSSIQYMYDYNKFLFFTYILNFSDHYVGIFDHYYFFYVIQVIVEII